MTDTAGLAWERRNWRRIEEVFAAAAELPAAERAAHLDAACGDDARLRARVAALLAAETDDADAVGAFAAAASPLAGRATDILDPRDEPPPRRIGVYEIVRELGRGGSSSVYLAERADGTFRKDVALKLVRRGLDTHDILARLHQERQILARLEHPNIAHLLDGGSTDDGRPYFVMERVDGLPIDEECRRRSLDIEARLELFLAVCRAVHFAHRNLTIHRDLKPSNILVTRDGVPKLLDFGIAKMLAPTEGLTRLQVTGPGLHVMTPAYASPEQLRGEALSTATDVYSLGVLLYRLLVGAQPYELEGTSLAELERRICELPPARPSQRVDAASLQTLGLPTTQLRRHRARLEGDLDTILQMALRKEPERRYGSVEQLADDLRRHLDGLPVRAQPDRWRYRARKFAVRHRRTLAATALAVLALAGTVSFYSVRLIEERNRAVEASQRATLESAKSTRVTEFLQQIFAISNPSRSLGESVTAQQLLDRGAAQIESELRDEPAVQASLMAAISQSYSGLGLYDEAEEQLERSHDLLRALHEPPHDELATSHQRLGNLRVVQGRFDDAERHFVASFEQRQALYGAGDRRSAESEAELAALAQLRGRLDEAEERYQSALTVLRAEPGARDAVTLQTESNLTTLFYARRRYDEAAALGRDVLEQQRIQLGPRHPDTLATEQTLAAILSAAGRHGEAEPLLRVLWLRQHELLGVTHPDTALAANNLATALFNLERYDEAEALYRDALARQTEAHGPTHPYTIATMLNLADLVADGHGDDATARGLYEEALERRRQVFARGSLDLVSPLMRLGRLELRTGHPAAAEEHLDEARSILERDRASAAPRSSARRLADAESLLGEALLAGGARERALPLLERGAATLRAELGAQHPKSQEASDRLARAFAADDAS
ncbi:MAG: serine/threonine-protein kinase [Acidobacteriota bacterium]